MGLPRGMITLTCAGMLLAPKARPGDRCPKEIASACASTTEIETGSDFPPLSEESSTRECNQKEKNGKRGLFRSWFHMAAETQGKQPDWLSPLATTSGRLKQEFRYDIWDQPGLSSSPVRGLKYCLVYRLIRSPLQTVPSVDLAICR